VEPSPTKSYTTDSRLKLESGSWFSERRKRTESRKNTAGKLEFTSLEVEVDELEERVVDVAAFPAESLIKLKEQILPCLRVTVSVAFFS
jgi:hypothetical protein